MPSVLFFSRKELAAVVAVGITTGLVDHQALSVLFASFTLNSWLTSLNSYLFHVTGGPLFGDFLQTWLEYGAVFAACLVRKPAAGTIALTINGFCQVFVYGTHDPHLFYGVSGLGADIVFASFHFKKYDIPAICLAGIACGIFWYPIVWFTHGIPFYPPFFIASDFGVRVLGSAVGDGLLGAALALVILKLAGRKWKETRVKEFGNENNAMKHANVAGVMMVGFGVVVMVLTYAFPPVSNFFSSIGPKIAEGIPQSEEYNPGYVIGLLLVFLVLTVLAFRRIDFAANSGHND
ncbi:MAG: ECF transporter S component [Thaumarchaeota archaeon]|nr:ECF transporter S component [Nitrososphaerota archaeon]